MTRPMRKPLVAKIRRQRSESYGQNWGKIKEERKRLDDNKCIRCLRTGNQVLLTVDHILPVSKGGKTVLSNLRTLCLDCHILVTRSSGGKALLKSLGTRKRSSVSSGDIKDYL